MVSARTRKRTRSTDEEYTPTKPQKRAKRSTPTTTRTTKRQDSAIPRDPRILLLAAQKALDKAIDNRKEAQKCLNQTQQHRVNMQREWEWTRVQMGGESSEVILAEQRHCAANEEVDGAEEWVVEMLEEEAKLGSALNLLWEEVRLLDEIERGITEEKKEIRVQEACESVKWN